MFHTFVGFEVDYILELAAVLIRLKYTCQKLSSPAVVRLKMNPCCEIRSPMLKTSLECDEDSKRKIF